MAQRLVGAHGRARDAFVAAEGVDADSHAGDVGAYLAPPSSVAGAACGGGAVCGGRAVRGTVGVLDGGPEGEGDDLVARLRAAERHEGHIHVVADLEQLGVRLSEATLDEHGVASLSGQLHLADAVRAEGSLAGAGRLGLEALHGEAPQPALPGEGALGHVPGRVQLGHDRWAANAVVAQCGQVAPTRWGASGQGDSAVSTGTALMGSQDLCGVLAEQRRPAGLGGGERGEAERRAGVQM